MKEFLQLMRRFVSPYKKYIGWAILLNILSAVFNVFSFTFLIPILSILFKTEGADKVYHFMEWGSVMERVIWLHKRVFPCLRIVHNALWLSL